MFYIIQAGSSKKVDVPTKDDTIKSTTEETSIDKKQDAEDKEKEEVSKIDSKYQTPSQVASEKRILELEKNLNALHAAKNSMPRAEIQKQINKLSEDLKKEKQSLKRKRQNAEHQRKHRTIKRSKLEEVCRDNSDIKRKLALRDSAGRPSLNVDQPLLLKAIADIAIIGSASDARRRSESIRTVKTLDDLTAELNIMGFTISRSATYLRLLPRNSSTIEGRRHTTTVPVKLSRAQADYHRSHIDTQFAATSIRYLETLASILGPTQVFFLSQDDKARVPLGITAANKQAPILMHMEYRVCLPDHDWVVAERHKLIPSIYAGIVIAPKVPGQNKAVGYSGPTFIAIRSGKHCSSSANTHAQDFETLLTLEEFKELVKTEEGFIKPVIIVTVDGGPDENPRYQKVISFAISHFKKHDLDAIFLASNAPGRSAYNRVEKRMAPLSRELSGLILPHDHYGSHLDENGRTIDVEMEQNNFAYAGKTLAEIWSSLGIDSYPVTATYIASGEPDLPDFDMDWYSTHVRESQYLLQIVKCKDKKCCSPARSGLFRVLKERFIPPPIKMKQTSNDIIVSEEGEFIDLSLRLSLHLDIPVKGFLKTPYDYFCPSIKSQLSARTCGSCGLYHASQKSANRHKKIQHGEKSQNACLVRPLRIAARRANELMCIVKYVEGMEDAEWLNEEEVNLDSIREESKEKVTEKRNNIITDIKKWLEQPWSASE